MFNDSGLKAEVARNINNQLEDVGFKNLGVDVRKNLIVLKRTKMPAVLVEAGFINNEKDNYIFDQEFDKIANAIADGILESIPVSARNTGNTGNTGTTGNTDNKINSSGNVSSGRTNSTKTASSMNTVNQMDSANPVNNADSTNNSASMNTVNSVKAVGSMNTINTINPINTAGSINTNNYTNELPECNCDNNNSNSNNSYSPQPLYRVQTGAYRNKENADRMLNSLLIDGFPAFIIYEDGYYKVQVGAYALLSNAIKMERRLRRFHYNTYITT